MTGPAPLRHRIAGAIALRPCTARELATMLCAGFKVVDTRIREMLDLGTVEIVGTRNERKRRRANVYGISA